MQKIQRSLLLFVKHHKANLYAIPIKKFWCIAGDHTSSRRATPAKIHFDFFSLDFILKVQIKVGPLSLVLYKGHSYMCFVSCLSTGIAFTNMTGTGAVSSFSFASASNPVKNRFIVNKIIFLPKESFYPSEVIHTYPPKSSNENRVVTTWSISNWGYNLLLLYVYRLASH